jgi:adenine phosphoribosyltransferase
LTFIYNTNGPGAAATFAERYLLPLVDSDIQQLADLVDEVPNFPDRGIAFRHILGISQRPHGLTLCTSLLQTLLVGDWAKVRAIACCEAGGFVYAAALAARIDLPLRLIRKAGKLPPPIFSMAKPRSYISSKASDSSEERLELEQDAGISSGHVVVVEDVLSTGATLCARLQLLIKVGIHVEDIRILVVAEFPVHRGRELLRQRGFGRTSLRSLLVLMVLDMLIRKDQGLREAD